MHKNFKETIRHGWETNSSSSHSLVLNPTAKATFRKSAEFGLVEDGVLTINGESEFGWDWKIWDSPDEKINYLLLDGFPADRMRNILISHLQDVKSVVFAAIGDGYIDHQSQGTSYDISMLDDDEIWAFLTNPTNHFRGGNDNEEGPW